METSTSNKSEESNTQCFKYFLNGNLGWVLVANTFLDFESPALYPLISRNVLKTKPAKILLLLTAMKINDDK